MKRDIVLGLATASLVYALAALADSHQETQPQSSVPPRESAATMLEVKATSNGRVTVTSSDGKHALECDVLTIPLVQEGAHEFLARGAVVMQIDDRKGKADSIRLQIKNNGEWSVTTDAITVGK